MGAALKSHMDGATLVLTISQPERRNALDPSMYAAGIEALNAAETSPDVHCVVLTGDGMHFCSGGNLQRLGQARHIPRQEQAASVDGLHGWIEAIHTFPKPVIAAVEGAAAGAGFSLVLACDMVVASVVSTYSVAHSRVGLSPDGGATWQLMQAMPRATAMWLMSTGNAIPAQRLYELGLVSQLSPEGQALTHALRLAQQLAGQSESSLSSIKELCNDALDRTLPEQLRAERDHFVTNLNTPAAAQKIQTFLAKRSASAT